MVARHIKDSITSRVDGPCQFSHSPARVLKVACTSFDDRYLRGGEHSDALQSIPIGRASQGHERSYS